MQPVTVSRGKFADPVPPFGPLPGVRIGDVLAYEFELPERFIPKHGHARLERTFVLLDLGVSMSCPAWSRTTVDGLAVDGIDPKLDEAVTWYVDLVHITADADRLIIRDLYLDVMVPTDGRHQRMLDLDEFADAIEAGTLPVEVAVDALRRWQAFSIATSTRTATREVAGATFLQRRFGSWLRSPLPSDPSSLPCRRSWPGTGVRGHGARMGKG